MKVRPIHFVPDIAAAVRFYEALGLTTDASARSGHWIELAASGGASGRPARGPPLPGVRMPS